MYGLSPEQYEAMLDESGGRCALCGREAKLHVDHNHETGKVRGLLCVTCNTGLGKLKVDRGIALLRQAISYIENSVDNRERVV